jgi:hypothetical protein
MNLFNVLAAVLPLVTQIPPLPTVLQAATQASVFALVYGSPEIDQIMTLMLVSNHGDGPPRPDQGGQRITPEWLNSLMSRV